MVEFCVQVCLHVNEANIVACSLLLEFRANSKNPVTFWF